MPLWRHSPLPEARALAPPWAPQAPVAGLPARRPRSRPRMTQRRTAQAALEQFLVPEARGLLGELDRSTGPAFRRLNAAVAGLVDEWGLVSFVPLDYSDEESTGDVLAQARPGRRGACVCATVERRRLGMSPRTAGRLGHGAFVSGRTA